MNPRMNTGDGISFPQENEFQFMGSWMPITPEKQIPVRSNPISVDRNDLSQLGRSSWQELPGFSNGYTQEMSNYDRAAQNFIPIGQGGQIVGHQNGRYYGCNSSGERNGMINHIAGSPGERNRMINHIAGSYMRAFCNETAGWNDDAAANQLAISTAVSSATANAPANCLVMNNAASSATGITSTNLLGMKNAASCTTTNRIPYTDTGTVCRPEIGNAVMNNAASSATGIAYANLVGMKNAASSTIANRIPLTDTGTAYRPEIRNLHSQASDCLISNLHSQDSNWRPANSESMWQANQNRCLGPNLQSDSASILRNQMPHYGFPIPYNLNLPPTEVDADSSVNTAFQLTPVETANMESSQISTTLNSPINEISRQGKAKQVITPTGNEVVERHCDELLQNIVDSSSAVISTPVKNKWDCDGETDGIIDLNKTPQQKTPKRRKHRPKVIVEGQPKKARKPRTPKSTVSQEKPTGKRKYVRKKSLKEPATEQAAITRESTDPTAETAAKSCRRALNFDLENTRDERQGEIVDQREETQQQNDEALNLNSASWRTELRARDTSSCRTNSTVQMSPQNVPPVRNQQSEAIYGFSSLMNQMLTGYISMPKRPEAATSAPIQDLHTQNLADISRNRDTRNANPCQKSSKDGYPLLQKNVQAEGIGQIVLQAGKFCENLDARQFMAQKTPSTQQILSSPCETRGWKREYCHTVEQMHPTATDQQGSLLCQELSQVNEYNAESGVPGSGGLRMLKKKKNENGLHNNILGLPHVTAVKDGVGQVKTTCTNNVNQNGLSSQRNHMILNPHFERGDVINRAKNGFNKSSSDWYIQSMASMHCLSKQYNSEPDSLMERKLEANRLTQMHNLPSQAAVEKCNLPPPTPPEKAPGLEEALLSKTHYKSVSEQKHDPEPTPSKPMPSKRGRGRREKKLSTNDNQQLSAGTQGLQLKPMYPISVDEIIHRLNNLNLNGMSNQGEGLEQHAIVPYRGDGTIVPYEGLEFIKKRKPRPKVDLDPETNRIWNLLMGKEGSEDLEGTDEEKEKRWEEEREVFRGRADSFIARMHLVQGDRRFSKWKGSVVDSVIGVFLTQNVSDHLSSSAFMSLAARFPRKPIINGAHDWEQTNILVEEPEVCIVDPDTIKWKEKKFSRPQFNQIIAIHSESAEHWRGSENAGTERKRLIEADIHSFEDEIPSSQDSNDSSIIQGNGGIRSGSGSNSEAEDPITGCTPNKVKGSASLPRKGNPISFEEFCNRINGSPLFHEASRHGEKQPEFMETSQQKSRLDGFDYLRSSCTFANLEHLNDPQTQEQLTPSNSCQWPMTSLPKALELEGFETYGIECVSSCSQFSEVKDVNSTSLGQVGSHVSETTVQLEGLSGKQPMHQQTVAMRGCQPSNIQPRHIGSQCEQSRSSLVDRTSVTEPVNPADVHAKRQNTSMQHIPDAPKVSEKFLDVERAAAVNNHTHSENKSFDEKPTEKVHSSSKAENKAITNSSKAKKGKAESEKNAIDWDSIRRHAQANGRRRERSEDTMDSLDYEALRCADVKDISNTIKERGMNNMLAERIKEFLNRLVRDHGSTDLEWLRDVPPDKAKDYLLSVRGLGLKSVECVRLLTLHHLAFPVDTNVGRIVVRLGWVPLQPLPESLQLHLLELYPLLETIQKYLWPRLCKLDQRTLYELHYQMITFGKVFCTKSKPNCNACPMRGECRHFASAFASARLALPGPEEKSITSSTAPITANRNPIIVTNSTPLLMPVNSPLEEIGSVVNKSEPIIEEPATPESECKEIVESDIEDAFYEDPDEIPTIKLSMEEFTMNLQNYVQENMELQEGDLSKALVALNPQSASIPAPKLKNVSRLRTEHYVYELPDSHPLLKGMDRREPDDPSPYLLAIWTPGETASSIQPPEQRCGSMIPGKFCNEKTCFSCNSIREANSQTVRGTILIPCRTAMRGSFPLNGTYFQVNEVFADHESSVNPIGVPREWIWKLPRRIVYFGTSVSTIFKGLSTEGIQYCFWKGFVCVRGFDQKTRAPKPLMARLHYPASRLTKSKNDNKAQVQ